MPITDCLLDGYEIKSNHTSGGFFGPKACGENYRRLLDAHPPYVDANSSLAGAYMANFMSYRKPHWNPDLAYPELMLDIELYKLSPGIGATQHFCHDLSIGLESGWEGILVKIHQGRLAHPDKHDFYDGLEAIVLGIQSWIARTATHARDLAEAADTPPAIRQNLSEIAEINEHITHNPPRSFPRGLPMDTVVPDGRPHVQRLRRVGTPGYAADPVLRKRYRRWHAVRR